ncbi:MAG: hypothetical protein KGR26_03005 [Cyanobacteria bacterium REEB65]|nr:hypothetical protein [Cyanobacteria bacterium REEB65]
MIRDPRNPHPQTPAGPNPVGGSPARGPATTSVQQLGKLPADGLETSGDWRQDYQSDKQRLATAVAAVASAQATKQTADSAQIDRPIYTGGAPALEQDQMNQAVIDSNPVLKALYSDAVQARAPWLLDAYQVVSRVAGPAGAFLNLAYNLMDAKKIFSDPRSPAPVRGAIMASTALAGVSAATATRLSLAAFKVLPMANGAMASMGMVAGAAGMGAGTLLGAIDTYNTFTDPNSTPAQRGFSLLSTGASAGLTLAIVAGVGGPIGIGLAAGTIGFMLAKGYLAKNPTANQLFSALGNDMSTVGADIARFLKI